MKLTAVIFDLDGTLLNTLDDIRVSLNHAMEVVGEPQHTQREVRDMVGHGIKRLVRDALPKEADKEEYEKALDAFYAHYMEHDRDCTAPYPGVIVMLDALRAHGIRTAVLSNKADEAVKELCEHYFDGKLELAAGARDGFRSKPAPDLVIDVMKRMHIVPEETAYIGDSEVDVETAHEAGLRGLFVDWGYRDRHVLEKCGAHTVVSSPADVVKWVLEQK